MSRQGLRALAAAVALAGQGPLVPAHRVHEGKRFSATPPAGTSDRCPGPAAGTFWAAKAENMASLANDRLGPGFPSRPY